MYRFILFIGVLTVVLIGFNADARTVQDLGKWEKGELLLENYSFEDGLAAWNLEDGTCCDRGGEFRWEIDNREAQHGDKSLKVIGVKATGTNWHAKVNQLSVSMEAGNDYTIVFWARAEKVRQVSINVQLQQEPWTTFHGQGKNFSLTEEWEEYSYTFLSTADIDRQMWVGLAIAQSDVDFWLDNFRYFEGEVEDDLTVDEPFPVDAKAKLATQWGTVKAKRF